MRPPAGLLVPLAGSLLWAGSGAGAEPASYRAPSYVARWDGESLRVLTPTGKLLCRWPVGAACSVADPDIPASSSFVHPGPAPVREVVRGATQLTWRWGCAPPAAIAEQVETCRLLPDRVEVHVGVRWRGQAPRLVRMVYGARLAGDCYDLEGLWRVTRQSRSGPDWQVEPVPGVYAQPGDAWFRKRVGPGGDGADLTLVMGGIDDGDVTSWDGQVIGRTPTDPSTLSWTQVRRYPVPAQPGGPASAHELLVEVHNASGNGGLWRGPFVLGPAAALAGTPSRDGWIRATAPGIALDHWCPDNYRQALEGRFTVSLTSRDRTREIVPENVTTGGRFLIPPYVVALEGEAGWWGLGTLDLPRAEDGLRVEYRNGSLSCPFLLATDPATRSGGWTEGPRVAILTAGSKEDVLEAYLRALPPRRAERRRDWWSGPGYCTWGDQVYAARLGQGSELGALTPEHLGQWLAALRKRRLVAPLITLDAGWWQLRREMIRDLQADGRHVILWTQPHWGPDTTRHAGWAVQDADGRPLTYDPGNWILDYTSPTVRAHMSRELRSYVARDGWRADGIKLDFAYTAAPVWSRHADPSWGAGEQYRARVLRFIYRTVKSAKADALVTGGTANPLFGRVQDVCRLNEDWFGDPQAFRRRAATVLAVGEWAECDDWWAYEHYLAAQAMERPVWGIFTLMSALYRGDRANMPHPLSAEWASRLSVIGTLAECAPVRRGQRCRYDPEREVLRRETADGSLVAAALPLEGTRGPLQVLVVARPGALLVCSVADGRVLVPVQGTVRRVVALLHDGTRRSAPSAPCPEGLKLPVSDCAGDVAYYEVGLSGRSHPRFTPG